jgi:hypothetical protein
MRLNQNKFKFDGECFDSENPEVVVDSEKMSVGGWVCGESSGVYNNSRKGK